MNNCIVLDGRKVAEESNSKLSAQASNLTNKYGRKPCLAAILVGDDPASATYIAMKEKACKSVGLETKTIIMNKDSTTEVVLERISALNEDENVDGILLQHPVPKGIDEIVCFNNISLNKDVDGVTTLGYGNMAMGLDSFGSCTPFGIMRLLESYQIDCSGKLALVVGRSQILGKPMSAMLLNKNATTITAHSKTENLPSLLKQADIVIAAVGKPKFIKCTGLKKGSILIDAGYHPIEKCGDVDMNGIEDIVSAYTPVPGGVGPMTINTLIYNTIKSMEKTFNV